MLHSLWPIQDIMGQPMTLAPIYIPRPDAGHGLERKSGAAGSAGNTTAPPKDSSSSTR
ncbi:MAG: hypothetical protein PHI49_03400 [Halothiobacillaceae bacterium]|jgi:hypothetical protein|nr:hypothetical protein [Halothiobacillaceae bacterium]